MVNMNVFVYPVLMLLMEHAKVSHEELRIKVDLKQFRKCMLIVSEEAKIPPPVQQISPPNVEANRLKVLIAGLVPSTVRGMSLARHVVCCSL